MTPADRLRFAQAFNRLAVATRLPVAEADAAMQQVYWDGLREQPIEAVTAAAGTMETHARWFPKVAEWREAAYRHQVTARLQLPDGRDEPWHDECETCGDTGWVLHHCYPGSGNTCGHRHCRVAGRRSEHTYVRSCPCRPTNRTLQRHHAILTSTRS